MANAVVLNVQVKGEGSLKDLAANLDRVEVSADDARGRLSRLASGADAKKFGRQWAGSLDQAEQGINRVSRATSNANQVLFTAGDAVQDVGVAFQQGASAGEALGNAARFAGNNIAFGAEQIALLASQTGGAQGAAAALRSSLLGLGGAILGIQLAVSVLPKVISLLTRAGESAKEFQEALDSTELVKFTGELERLSELEFSVPTDQIDTFLDNTETALSQVRANIQAVEALQAAASGGGGGLVGVGPIATQDRVRAVAQLLDISEDQARQNLQNQTLAENTLSVLQDQGKALTDLERLESALLKDKTRAEAAQSRLNALRLREETLTGNTAANQEESAKTLEERIKSTRTLVELERLLKEEVEAGNISLEDAAEKYADISSETENLTPPDIAFDPGDFDVDALIAEIDRLYGAYESAFDGAPPPIPVDDIDEADKAALQFAQRLRALESDFQQIQKEAEAGLLTPFQQAQAEIRNIEGQIVNLLQAGIDPSSEGIQDLVDQLEAAKLEAAAISQAIQAIDGLARGVGDALAFTILGDQRAEEQLREEQARLQEQLAETENADRRARIQKDLRAINEELQRFATLQGRITEGFKQLGDVARGVLGRIISDLATAAAKAAILSFIPGIGQASFVGNFATALVPGVASGGPISGPGSSTSDSILARLSDGEFVINARSAAAAPRLIQAINDDPGLARSLGSIADRGFAAGGFVPSATFSPSSLRSPTLRMGRRRRGMDLNVQVTGELTADVEQIRASFDKNATLKAQ